MTDHEAIEFLKNMIGNESMKAIGRTGFYSDLCNYHVEALEIAIKRMQGIWCRFRSEKNCDFCAFASDCEIKYGKLQANGEQVKEGEAK